MSFSEIFIRRPVLSTVVSLMILLLGGQGIFNLSVRQYPEVEETVITITTAYPGASRRPDPGLHHRADRQGGVDRRERRLRHLAERASASRTVSVHMRLNADPTGADRSASPRCSRCAAQLPDGRRGSGRSSKGTGQQFALMYLASRSRT